MAILRAGDTISGQEGKAFAVIDGLVQDLFFIKSLEASFEKNKVEVKTLGKRSTQHKTAGWSGTGTMTIYYVSSLFRELALKYAKTGKETVFSISVVNNDPHSTIGTQSVVLHNVTIDKSILAKLDVEGDALEEDIDFTFDDFDILASFKAPEGV